MPPRRQFDIPQANLQRLMNMTPRPFYQRKSKCRLVAQQYGAGSRKDFQRSRPKYPIYYNEARCSIVCPSGARRYSYIRFYGPPHPKSPVWVWCSCEDFAYRLEWVLTQIGCSSVATGYSGQGVAIRNERADIRNPDNKPGLCKHLLLAAEVALKQTKDYASEMGQKEAAVTKGVQRDAGINSQRGQVMTFK